MTSNLDSLQVRARRVSKTAKCSIRIIDTSLPESSSNQPSSFHNRNISVGGRVGFRAGFATNGCTAGWTDLDKLLELTDMDSLLDRCGDIRGAGQLAAKLLHVQNSVHRSLHNRRSVQNFTGMPSPLSSPTSREDGEKTRTPAEEIVP